jgi:hypothetical protein
MPHLNPHANMTVAPVIKRIATPLLDKGKKVATIQNKLIPINR